jgi:hypothetical protein
MVGERVEQVRIGGKLSGGAGGAAAGRRILPAEILGDGTMAGVIGASAIALFFLLIDTARREPLFTPSVMASALLRGEAPTSGAGVDLSMVAAYSVLHGAAFVAVGVLAAWATAMRHASVATFTLALALFATLELGFLVTCIAVDRSLLDVVGVAPATVGNLLAAIGMAAYLHRWPHDSIEEREGHLPPER